MGCLHTNLCLMFLCYTAPTAMVLDARSASKTVHGLLTPRFTIILLSVFFRCDSDSSLKGLDKMAL